VALLCAGILHGIGALIAPWVLLDLYEIQRLNPDWQRRESDADTLVADDDHGDGGNSDRNIDSPPIPVVFTTDPQF